MKTMKPIKKVLLLLANGFEIYEASVFIDVLGWNEVDGDGTTKVVICGLQKEIKGTFGVTLLADVTLNEVNIDEYEALAIPGGFGVFHFFDQAYSEQFGKIIRTFDEKQKLIASICTGAMPIGNSGVLSGRRATTYNENQSTRQQELKAFGVDVVNEPVVIDRNVITSWNPSTALDVAFLVLERLTSKAQADFIRKIMGFDPRTPTRNTGNVP